MTAMVMRMRIADPAFMLDVCKPVRCLRSRVRNEECSKVQAWHEEGAPKKKGMAYIQNISDLKRWLAHPGMETDWPIVLWPDYRDTSGPGLCPALPSPRTIDIAWRAEVPGNQKT